MDLVCDTNFWYELVHGTRSAEKTKAAGHRLLVSPVAYLELVSKINHSNFSLRQAVCEKIVRHADGVLLVPDEQLAKLWGIPFKPHQIDWKDAFQSVVDARDASHLQSGVLSADSRNNRLTNVAAAESWRRSTEAAFLSTLHAKLDSFVPGYTAARTVGKTRFLKRPFADLLRVGLRQTDFVRLLLIPTYYRALDRAGQLQAEPSSEQVDTVFPLLEPYIRVFIEYFIDAASQKTPETNDLGDLELFIYMQNSRRLATHDGRWIKLANDAGQSAWLCT
jgi:hypothetical protein